MTVPATVVLGVGNLLLGDDGVGVHVADRLAEGGLGPEVRIMDGGTLGLDLLPELDGVRRLVIVDAVDHRMPAGTVGTWRGEDVVRIFSRPLSVHQVGVDALLGTMRLVGTLPPEVVVVGVQPADLEPGIGLSEPVAAAVPALIRLVRAAARGVVVAGPLPAAITM